MKGWIRRLRGIAGIGTLWGLAGAVVGTLGGLAAAVFGGAPLLAAVANFGLGGGGVGFLLGTTFAGVLTMMERRRTLDELTPGRAAFWGALAGSAFPAMWFLASIGTLGTFIPLDRLLLAAMSGCVAYGTLAAGLAAGTVSLARRAPAELIPGMGSDEHELLGAPNDR